MANIWLRVALALYGLGLLYVLVALTRTKELLNRLSLHAAYLGMIFHFVAIAETVHQSGDLGLASLSVAASVLGFLIMVVFLIVYMVYQTPSPGVVVFPLVFLLTFVGASGQEPFVLASTILVLVCITASTLPALRVLKVSPSMALREEC